MTARHVVRYVIDVAALWAGATAAYIISGGSVVAAIASAALIGCYGVWCFYDGGAA